MGKQSGGHCSLADAYVSVIT